MSRSGHSPRRETACHQLVTPLLSLSVLLSLSPFSGWFLSGPSRSRSRGDIYTGASDGGSVRSSPSRFVPSSSCFPHSIHHLTYPHTGRTRPMCMNDLNKFDRDSWYPPEKMQKMFIQFFLGIDNHVDILHFIRIERCRH